jgi:hypothetical protein
MSKRSDCGICQHDGKAKDMCSEKNGPTTGCILIAFIYRSFVHQGCALNHRRLSNSCALRMSVAVDTFPNNTKGALQSVFA